MTTRRPLVRSSGKTRQMPSGDSLPSDCLPSSGVSSGSYTNASITVDASGRVTAASSGSASGVCDLRLTLTSATPILTSNVTGATTLYATPYKGNRVALYDTGNSQWIGYTTSELSLSLSGLTASTLYDIYLYNSGTIDSPTLTLEAVAWTNSTTRATALAKQDGIYVKTGALGRRYIGMILTNSTGGQIDCVFYSTSAVPVLGVWNYYHRVEAQLCRRPSTSSWAVTSTSWIMAGGSANNRCDIICGVQEDYLKATLPCQVVAAASSGVIPALGYDSVSPSGFPAQISAGTAVTSLSTTVARGGIQPAAGYHKVNWIEMATVSGGTVSGAGSSGLLVDVKY